MSYTTTEREKISENIRQFLKQDQKEKFEHQHFGGDPFLVKRVLPMTPYDKETLENVSHGMLRVVYCTHEKRKKSPPPCEELPSHHGE